MRQLDKHNAHFLPGSLLRLLLVQEMRQVNSKKLHENATGISCVSRRWITHATRRQLFTDHTKAAQQTRSLHKRPRPCCQQQCARSKRQPTPRWPLGGDRCAGVCSFSGASVSSWLNECRIRS